MTEADSFLPQRVNAGSFVAAHSHAELGRRIQDARVVLPICSLGTTAERLAALAPLVLPPLYHEALTEDLKGRIVDRVRRCFPYYEGTRQRAEWSGRLEVVELPRAPLPSRPKPRILAFSVDTAVEEHGPHLPLATDTLQSYAALRQLAGEFDGFVVAPPVDYGHLTWGLPFGFSIDLTVPLVARYVTGFVNAMMDWLAPEALYVVDVHGSLLHRQAIQEGLKASRCPRHAFRWLYDSLAKFGTERGDVHAGGVETAMIQHIDPGLVDARWWPGRLADLEAGQMRVETAVALSGDLSKFIQHVESHALNGIVGNIRNFFDLDARVLLEQMMQVARKDVEQLQSHRPQ